MSDQNQHPEDNTKISAYYNAAYQGWVASSLERDKSLLTISAGAIGLIVTLLTTVGPATVTETVMYMCAMFTFIINIVSVVFIFERNKKYLGKLISEEECDRSDSNLEILDSVAIFSFMIGVVLLSIIGTSAGISQYLKKGAISETKKTESERSRESAFTIETVFNNFEKAKGGEVNTRSDKKVKFTQERDCTNKKPIEDKCKPENK